MLIPLEDGIWDADARAELEDVAETIDARLANVEEDVDTLGGLAWCSPATCRSSARSSSIRAAGGSKSPTATPAACRG